MNDHYEFKWSACTFGEEKPIILEKSVLVVLNVKAVKQ